MKKVLRSWQQQALHSVCLAFLISWTTCTGVGDVREMTESEVPDLIVYNEDFVRLINKSASQSSENLSFSSQLMLQNDFPFLDLNQPSLYKNDDLIGCIEPHNQSFSLTNNSSNESDRNFDYFSFNTSLSTDNLVTNSAERKSIEGLKRRKLWRKVRKNLVHNSSKSNIPIVRVNIKSKKLYMNKNASVSSFDPTVELSKNDLSDSGSEKTVFMGRQKTLLTRHFLKVAPERESSFTTLAPYSSTMRVRSRMSRDNRRTIQAIERQRNYQVLEKNRQSIDFAGSSGQLNQNPINRVASNKVSVNEATSAVNLHANYVHSTKPLSPSGDRTNTDEEKNRFLDSESNSFDNDQPKPTNQVVYPSLPVIQPLQQNVKPKLTAESQLHQKGGRVQLSGSSSSPVEPIKPLLQLGGRGGGVLPQHPVFDDAAPRNLTGLTGSAAYLHCVVHNLANRSVSWIRQRDLHILTVDRYTYTTDQRFQVIHSEDSKDWILKIKYAQVRDSGNYECQISTKPVKSYVVNLSVFEPQAAIVGAPDMHVDSGSTINLTCVIAHSPEPPAYIFWYHDDEVVNYDSPRGGVTVVTERGNVTRGYLLIQEARGSDSGNYSCAPSNTAPTSLRVHVLNGEMPAAMQTSSAHPRADHRPLLFLLCLLLLRHLVTVAHGSQLPTVVLVHAANVNDSTSLSRCSCSGRSTGQKKITKTKACELEFEQVSKYGPQSGHFGGIQSSLDFGMQSRMNITSCVATKCLDFKENCKRDCSPSINSTCITASKSAVEP